MKKLETTTLSELASIRVKSGVNPRTVAKEIGMGYYNYLSRESGEVTYKKEDKNEKFFYDVCHVISRLEKELTQKTLSISDNLLLDDESENNLYYLPLTETTYEEIKTRLYYGENHIVLATEYLVDYEEIEKRLKEENIYNELIKNK